jgi:hypothetical protein
MGFFDFLKKPQQPATFKQRVAAFWEWYPRSANRLFEMIERGQSKEIADFTGQFMDSTLPGLSWVFGPGPGGHSFTVTGDGILPRQLLAQYWHSRAVTIPRWTFHASRQATPAERLAGMAIGMQGGVQVDVEHFRLRTKVNAEQEKIDLVGWHPALSEVPEEHRVRIFFLLLDEALGEFGTDMWLGTIDVEPFEADAETRSLATLPKFVEQVGAYYGWKKLSPVECYTVYECETESDARRGDTLIGTSCMPGLIMEFLENGGRLPADPLEGSGAEFAYVALDGSLFPEGEQTAVRGEIEDTLSAALQRELSGRTLGGAFGANESYIDLLLFDGANSRRIVEQALASRQLSRLARVESFL